MSQGCLGIGVHLLDQNQAAAACADGVLAWFCCANCWEMACCMAVLLRSSVKRWTRLQESCPL